MATGVVMGPVTPVTIRMRRPTSFAPCESAGRLKSTARTQATRLL